MQSGEEKDGRGAAPHPAKGRTLGTRLFKNRVWPKRGATVTVPGECCPLFGQTFT